MALTLFLKKKNHNNIKIGILGFSWTTFFFGLFVPLFRKDFKVFLPFFLLYIAAIYFMPYTYSNINGMVSFQMSDDLGIYSLFSTVFYWIINIFGAVFYNKIYTQALINKGYIPVSVEGMAILKAYRIKFADDFDEEDIAE